MHKYLLQLTQIYGLCLSHSLSESNLAFSVFNIKKKKPCDRRLLRWLPSILASQYLQSCITPYHWTWEYGKSDMFLLRLGDRKTCLLSCLPTISVVLSCSDRSQLPCSEMLCGEVHVTGNRGFLATAESPSLTTCKELNSASNMCWVRKGLLPSLESWDDPRQHFDYSLCGTLIHTQITQKPEINKSCIKLRNLEVIH